MASELKAAIPATEAKTICIAAMADRDTESCGTWFHETKVRAVSHKNECLYHFFAGAPYTEDGRSHRSR
jgi:hypothetical protein